MVRLASALLCITLGTACAGRDDRASPGDTDEVAFALDLAAFPGGLDDANSSIAFPIDLSHSTKKISKLEPSQIVEIYDRVGCWHGSEDLLTRTAEDAGIPDADPAKVRWIELTLTPDPIGQDNPLLGAGVCYGYRALDGTWHYDLTVVAPTLDDWSHAMTARIPARGGPMDALEIAFESNYPPAVHGVRYGVDAADAAIAGEL